MELEALEKVNEKELADREFSVVVFCLALVCWLLGCAVMDQWHGLGRGCWLLAGMLTLGVFVRGLVGLTAECTEPPRSGGVPGGRQ